jgi:hypothetical protein
MALTAEPYRLFLWLDQMGYEDAVIDLCMAFYAPDILEMQGLVRQPVMRLHDVYAFPVGQQLELVKIGMAGKADSVVIGNGGFQILRIPDTDMVRMRVALPAAEFLGICFVMHALQVFFLDFFKLVMRIILVVPVAIKASPVLFKPGFERMRELFVFGGMAIETGKALMVPFVIFLPREHIIGAHMPGQYPVVNLIGKMEDFFAVTPETLLVLIHEIVYLPEGIQ